jgi:hypothetical protein
MPQDASAILRKYVDLAARVEVIAGWAQEAGKIRRALVELDDWLLHGE